jgi:hypothetical protein
MFRVFAASLTRKVGRGEGVDVLQGISLPMRCKSR